MPVIGHETMAAFGSHTSKHEVMAKYPCIQETAECSSRLISLLQNHEHKAVAT